jgi:hypothetical protein
MKKFTSLLISGSLALAAAALAQPPSDTSSPTMGQGKQGTSETTETGAGAGAGKKHHGGGGGKAAKADANAGTNANASNPEATTAEKQGGAKAERRAARREKKNEGMPKTEASVSAESNVSATGSPNEQEKLGGKHGRKGKNARGANADAKANANVNANASATASPAGSASAGMNTAATGGEKNAKGKMKKVETQQLQQIKTQHANFKAQPKPDKVPAVTFNMNYRIEGADRWQGPQYEVFRAYRPERHDERWYRSHFPRVELIGGGYYYWNNGYWYPAWGFNPANEYYVYDGPIYVGHRAEPPDRVIADVQAELQYLGYYTGEVDGLLGPLTRQALAQYQADNGLMATAAIDEPTLDSLGMS